MTGAAQLIATVVAVLAVIHIAYFIAVKTKRYDVVDVAWGLMFMVVALVSFFINSNSGVIQIVVTALVLVWGFRLSSHIQARRRATSTDDPRYEAMRIQWGKRADLRAYSNVFILQALLVLVISAPVIYANLYSGHQAITPIFYAGIIVWLIGFVFESVGDWQLQKFLGDSRNKGKLMMIGLWRYTRHPNYFGEVAQWWGIYFMVLSVPDSAFTIFGPLVITFFILFVSGVALTEKRFEGRKGWSKYKRQTSMFIPWFPRMPR